MRFKLYRDIILMVVAFLVTIAVVFFSSKLVLPAGATQDKVTICHATESESNPYVQNQPDKSGDVSGHDGHSGDIIPPFDYGEGQHYAGKNWDEEHQAIYENDCEVPDEEEVTPTPTPTVEVTPTPTPVDEDEEECEEGYHLAKYGNNQEYEEEECVPDVTPTPTPEEECDQDKCEEPTPTPTPETGHPTDVTFQGSTTEAPVCGDAAITKESINFHIFRKGDQAVAKWWPNPDANKATIYYKQVGSAEWQYSITTDNTGYVEISGLDSMDITFALQEHKNCGGGTLTNPVVDGNTSGWVLFR